MNLVIILEESLGAEFVGSLGGHDLTPNLDRLASEGIWFERLYSTGMSTARGLEAIVSGFTPSTAEAVVKAPRAQEDFFTLAGFLRQRGYATSFHYGGASRFDDLQRFFLNNGFDTVIDEQDHDDPVYRGFRGVSDEDLFDRAHREFLAAEAPFFSLVLTSSNHEPFDLPSGRVAPERDRPDPGEPPGRAAAIKYSDWALGRFLERAREAPYWDDTVFLVVADHNARIWGGQLVPVEKFRVPGVILGRVVRPRRIEGISSQIDLLPTLVSIIGVSGAHPAIGRDLTRAPWQNGAGRATMQFHGLQAYLEGRQVVILQKDRAPQGFRRMADGALEPFPRMGKKMRRKALAYAKWGPWLLDQRAYRLPETTDP